MVSLYQARGRAADDARAFATRMLNLHLYPSMDMQHQIAAALADLALRIGAHGALKDVSMVS